MHNEIVLKSLGTPTLKKQGKQKLYLTNRKNQLSLESCFCSYFVMSRCDLLNFGNINEIYSLPLFT